MSTLNFPLIIDPDVLEKNLGAENLLIIDLCKDETYAQSHIPGAIHLQYSRIFHTDKPVMGLVPEQHELTEVLSSIGMTDSTHVVAYDDDGGGKASRFLWTLDVVGHQAFSLLDGGLAAWVNEGHPVDSRPETPVSGNYPVILDEHTLVDKDYVLKHLDDPNVLLVDGRSPEEYSGEKKFSARGGHIPGAVNLNWLLTLDQQNNMRLISDEAIKDLLAERGITPDKEIILYCQSHHRSAHSYIVLKHLEYPNIKGYPGAWSEWGNLADTPVEK